jgi:hypothetical protein
VPEALEGLNLELIVNICGTFKEMKMKTKFMKKLITLTCLSSFFLTFGCYKSIAIKLTEVPKLNNTYSVSVGSTNTSSYNYSTKQTDYSSSPIIASSVRHIRRTDGRILEVKGKTPVIITTKAGKYTFKHPTISRLYNGRLKIAGGNRGEQVFMLDSIQKVEIKQFNFAKTMLVWAGIAIITVVPYFMWINSKTDNSY